MRNGKIMMWMHKYMQKTSFLLEHGRKNMKKAWRSKKMGHFPLKYSGK
eukprot:CAMPEP_0170362698 /NCGR_PEP_ID=MMETSP0117_2-20130122/4470_1 /TAXON_ID=400756 /ORGANISM="Durinskia baltica, Strain CSIRO CS-38" /LENGTH=47 /DNA_ID= /DNA_START= /DNA_END= /DNA_ORIENTATION=